MARSGLYQDNEHRQLPFVAVAAPALPDDAVVDFGCTVGPGAGYLTDAHAVYLSRVRLAGGVLTFEFASDCPGLAGRTLKFERTPAGDPEFATQFAESDGNGCPASALWDGFLVTGRLGALLAAVQSAGGELAVGRALGAAEPGTIQVLSAIGVTGVTLLNREPPQSPDPCCPGESSSGPGTRRSFTWATCLVGDLKLVEGYNLTYRVSGPDNSITVNAAKGGGAGEPCEDVPLRPDVPAPDRVHCRDVIGSVNGLAVRRLQLVGGLGVHVVPGPGAHEVTVLVDLRGVGGTFAATEQGVTFGVGPFPGI